MANHVAIALDGVDLAPDFTSRLRAVEGLVADERLAEAGALARAALADPSCPHEVAVRFRLEVSSIAFVTGGAGAAVAQANAVLGTPDLPDELFAAAHVTRLRGLIALDDFAAARQAAESILAGGEGTGGDRALAQALLTLALIAWHEGRVADSLALVRAAVRRSDQAWPGPWSTRPRLAHSAVLTAVGDFGGAAAVLAEDEAAAELAPDMWTAGRPIFRARLDLAAGRLEAAAGGARRGAALAEQLGTRLYMAPALSTSAAVALLRGELGEVQRLLQEYREQPLGARIAFGTAAGMWIEARLADAGGDRAGAVEALAPLFADPLAGRRLYLEEPAAPAFAVRVGGGCAQGVVACVEQLAAENRDFGSVVAAAAHARGLLDGDVARVLTAAAEHRHPWARASAAEDAGVLLERDGDSTRARSQLHEALSTYEAMGAVADAARVRIRLRDLAARRRAQRPVTGWASLTDTERKVALVVAEGVTNAEAAERMYLSRHTVDFHLRHIFQKLTIRSRVELVRATLDQTDRPS